MWMLKSKVWQVSLYVYVHFHVCVTFTSNNFWGASQNSWKATNNFVKARSSVRPHGTTLLTTEGFSWNLIFEYFLENMPEEIQVSLTFKNRALLYIGWVYRYPPNVIFYIFFSTNISTEYFKHAEHSPFFSSKCRLFHNAAIFGCCIIHILRTGCAKI
jgi:hypothetical protein